MDCGVTDIQLREWISRRAPELDEHLADCPSCRERTKRLRSECVGQDAVPTSAGGPAGSGRIVVRPGVTTSTPAPIGSGPLPDRIGHYHVKRVLGTGGMGTVYEAVQENPRRTVAVKVMRAGVTSRSAQRRFEYESQILGRLRHPGIAQVYEAGTHRDGAAVVPFFAMEYIPNAKPITEYADARSLDVRQRLELFKLVCEALEHGHDKGVIHRDLKPGNILVDSAGQPRIIDFGVARATDSDLAVTTLQTDVGQLLGTLLYMSPEQCEGDPHDLDQRSDVYAMGVILYELLLGRHPHEVRGGTIADIARVIREEAPTRPSTVDRTLRGDLETIVLTALARDRDRRYRTMSDFREDIDRYLEHQPITARPDSLVYVVRKKTERSMQRHPVGWSLLAVLLASLIADRVGVPVLYRWTYLNNRYEQFMVGSSPSTVTPGALEHVRVVGLNDETDIEALAAAEGLTGVVDTIATRRTWRRLHGRLLEHLADSGAAAVAFDVAFRGSSEFDTDFVAGVERLQERGIDVVVAVDDWGLDDPADPDLSEAIQPFVTWGGYTIDAGPKAEWRVPLAMQRAARDPIPSLAFATVGAFRRPGTVLDIDFVLATEEIVITYRRPDPRLPRVLVQEGEPESIQTTGIAEPAETDPEFGLHPGDLAAHYQLEMPDDETLAASTIAYERVLAATPDQLRTWFERRVVLIANMRADTNDIAAHPSGRDIQKAYAHAVGVDQLLRGLSIRTTTATGPMVLSLAGAILGLLPGLAFSSRRVRRWLLVLAIAAAAVAASWWAFRSFKYIANPSVPILALLIATEFVAFIRRVHSEAT